MPKLHIHLERARVNTKKKSNATSHEMQTQGAVHGHQVKALWQPDLNAHSPSFAPSSLHAARIALFLWFHAQTKPCPHDHNHVRSVLFPGGFYPDGELAPPYSTSYSKPPCFCQASRRLSSSLHHPIWMPKPETLELGAWGASGRVPLARVMTPGAPLVERHWTPRAVPKNCMQPAATGGTGAGVRKQGVKHGT